MGGKNSTGQSQTSSVVPAWLSGILQPLLAGSAGKMGTLQDQGYNVLQGRSPNQGVSLEELQSGTQGQPPTSGMPKIPADLGP